MTPPEAGHRRLQSALISVYHKDGLAPIVQALRDLGVKLYSTGGTAKYIQEQGCAVKEISDLTGFPEILDGRVKTLHPKVFGGILARREAESHQQQLQQHDIPLFDLIIVDLYPFGETLKQTQDEATLIEKIDIGGIALIRAAAKNFHDVLIVPSRHQYGKLLAGLQQNEGSFTTAERKAFAADAFAVSSAYDTAIQHWISGGKGSANAPDPGVPSTPLRYGENPHQQARFEGALEDVATQLSGKPLSYNNLIDIEAAFRLMHDFDRAYPGEVSCAIFKHTNPCGLAVRSTVHDAWTDALACDPVSAFGGIIILNREVDLETAQGIHEHFYEVLIAPGFKQEALKLLKEKNKRILLQYSTLALPSEVGRSVLAGTLVQDADLRLPAERAVDYSLPTSRKPTADEWAQLRFAELACKHLKSNAIALVKDRMLIGGGIGQTSRIEALELAFKKARSNSFDPKGAALASDGFFPFADSVARAHAQGITCIIQPGGSIKDQESIDFCEQEGMCLVLTGHRHFRH